ncbi:MAG TPA: TonB-dependent receptor [Allosphingosinicella sp.]
MFRTTAPAAANLVTLIGLTAALLCGASPAAAQRANENAVTSAGDAFGSRVGNEQIGIYNPYSARGFSPVQAGNVRLEGLYFDLQTGFSNRLISGISMRVGISAQGYPFVAPTGIADLSLRKAGQEPVLSTVFAVGPYGGVSAEADGQMPLSSTLSVGGGVSVGSFENNYGGDERVVDAALIPRWTPSKSLEVIPFVSYTSSAGQEAQPIYFTAGSFLPPKVEARNYYGPSWAEGKASSLNYGLVSTARSGDWTLKGGLFRSVQDLDRSYVELALNTSPEGIADRLLSVEGDRRFASTSGELRATRAIVEGDRLHQIHLTVRGRHQDRRYGGGQQVSLGRRPLDEGVTLPEPAFTVGPQTTDEVRQYTGGIGYEGRWRDVGELTLGLQKTDYQKSVETPAGPLPTSKDSPWLFNATAAAHLSKKLSLYAGYAKGLEESPIAPAVARNRDEAPPAILTEQKDVGFRLVLPRNIRLVAGLFDVSKPYYALDNTLLFGRLGEVRHRGAEFSIAGSPIEGLTIILGTVFLDAEVSGEAVQAGLIGKRPIGTFIRYTNGAINYSVAAVKGLSLDASYESTSSRVADRMNTFFIPPRYVLSVGGRYRFKIGDAPATFRAQVANVTNIYGWSNAGEGFAFNNPRRLLLSLSADW